MLHRDIYNYTVKFGAACICHDARLLGLVSGIAGNAKAAMIARRELGRHVTAEDIATWNQDETLRDANFLNDLARAAQPLIFHARKSVLDLRARAGITAAYLPFAIYRPWAGPAMTDSARRQARHRLGLGDDEILICSFGFITPNKAVDAALQSFSLLRQSGIKARLSWVGSGLETIAPREPTLRSLELSDHVQFHRSYLSEESYRDYLLAADFGLQLRSGGRGNISGALQDCIAIGLPTVTNNDLAESLNAPSYIARVDDKLAPADIAASLRAMITDGRRRTAHEAERADYCARHSMENYAKALCDILAL
jgi:glycosyltransferase involved in cell wall biosynthesis